MVSVAEETFCTTPDLQRHHFPLRSVFCPRCFNLLPDIISDHDVVLFHTLIKSQVKLSSFVLNGRSRSFQG